MVLTGIDLLPVLGSTPLWRPAHLSPLSQSRCPRSFCDLLLGYQGWLPASWKPGTRARSMPCRVNCADGMLSAEQYSWYKAGMVACLKLVWHGGDGGAAEPLAAAAVQAASVSAVSMPWPPLRAGWAQVPSSCTKCTCGLNPAIPQPCKLIRATTDLLTP